MRTLLLAVGIVASSFAATTAHADTAAVIETAVAQKKVGGCYVLAFGQYYHRYDHLLAAGQEEITPEIAHERQYQRCPECMPPKSSEDLRAEIGTGKSKLTQYYREYLKERTSPTILNVPPGHLASTHGVAPGVDKGPPPPKVEAAPVVLIPMENARITPPAPAAAAAAAAPTK